MEQLIAREIPTLVADSPDDILQCAFEKARTRDFSVIHIVIKKALFKLLPEKWMDQTTNRQIAKYFDTSDTSNTVGEKQLSTNALMAPIAAIIKQRTSNGTATERSALKTEKLLKLQTVAETKIVPRKSGCLPSRTDFPPSYSSSDKDGNETADKWRPSIAPISTAVIDAFKKNRNTRGRQADRPNLKITLCLQVRHLPDPQPQPKGAVVKSQGTESVTSREKLL